MANTHSYIEVFLIHTVTRKLSSPRQRILAHLDMLFIDHGLFREAYNNLYSLPGGLWRSSQPSPRQIRKYQKKLGIKTIINLRGADTTRRYALEEEVCEELGITLINHKGLLSRSAPNVEAILRTRDLFRSIEYPALIHCKSGADRAGFACALYRHFQLGEPIERAQQELALRYGHIKGAKTGILDAFFDLYRSYAEQHPIEFSEWLQTIYDRDKLKAEFQSRNLADWIIDRLLHRE